MGIFIGLDPTINTARMALDGLSLRQQVISRNLANVDTPGYQAQEVTFEDALKHALTPETFQQVTTHPNHMQMDGQPAQTLSTITPRPGGSNRADQNNVDIDVEMTDMTETGIKYQALSQAASQRLLLLKSIAS